MDKNNIYESLANHLSEFPMFIPFSEQLIEILKANLTLLEAEVALCLPNKVVPFDFTGIDEIPRLAGLSREEMLDVLNGLSQKGIALSGKTEKGEKGFTLWQRGFGFPQVFHWKKEDTPHARKMAELINQHNRNPKVTEQLADTEGIKPYRYVPVSRSIELSKQGIYSFHMMEEVVRNARVFAVAHCPCRVGQSMVGKGCDHPTEVCLKFNDMAEFLIDKGFAREITEEEAMKIVEESEEIGLVHFVDNAGGNVQHNCNCCGCVCWNVGPIKRRRVPRDAIMATYFLRETDEGDCIGCGECAEICPVDAVKMEDDTPVVDLDWCIGCGVCSKKCPADAINMYIRPDRTGQLPAKTFRELHEKILVEKGLL